MIYNYSTMVYKPTYNWGGITIVITIENDPEPEIGNKLDPDELDRMRFVAIQLPEIRQTFHLVQTV